jgi:hypothetical protein
MKFELKSSLSQPLIPRGISTKYLTSGIVRDLADRLLDESSRKYKVLIRFINEKWIDNVL